MQLQKTAIIWFTNNLRTRNNRLLYEACLRYKNVIAVYCFNPEHFTENLYGFKKTERFRARFLLESVESLQKELEQLNISLLTYFEAPKTCIPKLCSKFQAEALFYQKVFTSEEISSIQEVLMAFDQPIRTYSYYDQFLIDPKYLPFAISKLPEIFTNFRKGVEAHLHIPKEYPTPSKDPLNLVFEESQHVTLQTLGFETFTTHSNSAFPFSGGEYQALERLDYYFFKTQLLKSYKQTRNGLVGTDYSSKLSPWLANGSLSAVSVYWEIKDFEAQYGSNASTYWLFFELLWRDYFKFLALKHGNQLFRLEGIQKREYPWQNDPDQIKHWINGHTDVPFINANMIELKETGWMSNRGRQKCSVLFY